MNKAPKITSLMVLLFGCGSLIFAYAYRANVRGHVMETQAPLRATLTAVFPSVDIRHFTPAQQQLFDTLKREYGRHPKSFDAAVLEYTAGVQEPWCADFVSWVMRDIGQPLANPHSGSWRIPGVYTLREYYQAAHRWEPASDTYVPTFGDVAIFAKSPSASHTTIVFSVDTKTHTMKTLGGNENSTIAFRTHSYLPSHEDLAGFGTLR